MPDNGRYRLETGAGERICEIVQASERLDRTKLATKLYNGQYLLQTIGTPVRILDLSIRAWSLTELQTVNAAEAACAVIAAKLDSTLISGTLMDAPEWTTVVDGQIWEASVKLAVIDA